MAGEAVAEQVMAELTERPDLVMVFAGGVHAPRLGKIAGAIREMLDPGVALGVSAEGLVGDSTEPLGGAGVSLFAATLPGTTLCGFDTRDLPQTDDPDARELAALGEAVGVRDDTRGVFFFADPFSVPAPGLIESLSRISEAIGGVGRLPVVGGMAASGNAPGQNVLVLNDQVIRAGGVGVTLSGDVIFECVVSQGCRPIGRPLIITDAHNNIIRSLGGQAALEALHSVVRGLDADDHQLLPNGVFVGRVVNEYKERFGRGDFLIRGVMGVDQNSGAVAVADGIRVGQTIQFHLRDATTASEDLGLLLDMQTLRDPPIGGLLFTCNGRSGTFFEQPHHDALSVARALRTSEGNPVPLAGFFAAGEIGPIGGRSFLHGHTAVLALLRPNRPDPTLM